MGHASVIEESRFQQYPVAAAKLYNAIRHESIGFPRWLDMEAIIVIYSNQRIF